MTGFKNKEKARNIFIKNKKTFIFLFIIIVFGGILRFGKLDYQSLWNDELSSIAAVADKKSLNEVIKTVRKDVHPPLYFCLLYLWQNLYGNSAVSLRFLSALFGTLSILTLFFLARILYSDREALISALILSTSYFGVYYSQEVRSYSLLLFLSICSYLFFVVIQPQSKAKGLRSTYLSVLSYTLYVIFTTLLIYTHYFGILVLLSQFILIIFFYWKSKDKAYIPMLISFFCIVLLYIPQIPAMKSKMAISNFWIQKPHFYFFIPYFNEYWGKSESYFLIALFCIFSFFYFPGNIKKEDSEPKPDHSSMLTLWVGVSLIAAYILSVFSTPVLTARNTIIILPPLILMIAKGITNLDNGKLVSILTALIFIAGVYSLFITNNYYEKITKEQFREVANAVLESKNIADESLVIACAWNADYFNYFFRQAYSPLRVSGMYASEKDIENLEKLVHNSTKKYLWYLTGHKYPSQNFLRYLNNNYRLLGQQRLQGCSFFLFAL